MLSEARTCYDIPGCPNCSRIVRKVSGSPKHVSVMLHPPEKFDHGHKIQLCTCSLCVYFQTGSHIHSSIHTQERSDISRMPQCNNSYAKMPVNLMARCIT